LIDNHQVEVGAGRHLPGAGLAERQHCGAAVEGSCPALNFNHGARSELLQAGVREVGVGLARRRGVSRACQDLKPYPEPLLARDPSCCAHRRLKPAHRPGPGAHRRAGARHVQRFAEARVQQRVQCGGKARQGPSEVGREGEHLDQLLQDLRLGPAAGLDLNARGQPREEAGEAVESRVRRARSLRSLQQPGRQPGEQLAPAGGVRGADAPVMPLRMDAET
jgi:hypothetical protein